MSVRFRVERLVAALPDQLLQDVAADPARALVDHFGLRPQASPGLSRRRGNHGFCDGMSFVGGGSDLVLYVPTSGRRENFTLARVGVAGRALHPRSGPDPHRHPCGLAALGGRSADRSDPESRG